MKTTDSISLGSFGEVFAIDIFKGRLSNRGLNVFCLWSFLSN